MLTNLQTLLRKNTNSYKRLKCSTFLTSQLNWLMKVEEEKVGGKRRRTLSLIHAKCSLIPMRAMAKDVLASPMDHCFDFFYVTFDVFCCNGDSTQNDKLKVIKFPRLCVLPHFSVLAFASCLLIKSSFMDPVTNSP